MKKEISGKKIIGIISSDKMDKTIVVRTVTRVPHPKFGKITKHITKFHAHDEKNDCHAGDKVLLIETRPLSKEKHWRVKEILERAA